MRSVALGLLLLQAALGGGCVVVVATAGVVGTVAATTVKTAGKVTVTTVKTTGRVASAAISSGGEVTALTLESAATLARTGKVVVVDGGSGAVMEMPWQDGLRLYSALQTGGLPAAADTAKIFRAGRVFNADLKEVRKKKTDYPLFSGDVIELRS